MLTLNEVVVVEMAEDMRKLKDAYSLVHFFFNEVKETSIWWLHLYIFSN